MAKAEAKAKIINRKRRRQDWWLKQIKLPHTNKEDLRAIQPELWYVIWEKNLTKPKVFRYSFISEYFAKVFCDRKLKEHRHHILQGKDLLDFGITHGRVNLRKIGMDGRKEAQIKYNFPDGLPFQNRKTIRTLYRRNLRRLLIKKEKNMGDQYILDKINEKPGAFFKKLSAYFYYQLTYSVTFPEWNANDEAWRIIDIKTAGKDKPAIIGEIANIIRCLETDYPDDKFDYKNFTYVSLGIKVHKMYKERFEKYFKKKGGTLINPNPEEAWRELAMRGFVPRIFRMDEPGMYKLCTTIGIDLVKVFPRLKKDQIINPGDYAIKGYETYGTY